jgi:restriction system protein
MLASARPLTFDACGTPRWIGALYGIIWSVNDTKPTPPNPGGILRDSIGTTISTFLDFAQQIWWFWVLVGAILLARVVAFVLEQRRLARSGIGEIDAMKGSRFEAYLATMFRRLGYSAEIVGSARGDYGGDLVVKKGGVRTIVQAKRYANNKVGIKAVQEAHAAKSIYGCDHAMVVTNSVFTTQAHKLAKATGVELWAREKLIKNLLQAQATAAPPAAQAAAEGEILPAPPPATRLDADRPTCARCGATVTDKVAAYCATNANRFGGLVYCYAHQRGLGRGTGSSTAV